MSVASSKQLVILPQKILLKFAPKKGTHRFTEYSWTYPGDHNPSDCTPIVECPTLITRHGRHQHGGHTYRKHFKNTLALQRDLLKRMGAKMAEGYYYVTERQYRRRGAKRAALSLRKTAFKCEEYAQKIQWMVQQERQQQKLLMKTPDFPRVASPARYRKMLAEREASDQLKKQQQQQRYEHVTPVVSRKRKCHETRKNVEEPIVRSTSVRRRLNFEQFVQETHSNQQSPIFDHLLTVVPMIGDEQQVSLKQNQEEGEDVLFFEQIGNCDDDDDDDNDCGNSHHDVEPSQIMSTPATNFQQLTQENKVKELETENLQLKENIRQLELSKQGIELQLANELEQIETQRNLLMEQRKACDAQEGKLSQLAQVLETRSTALQLDNAQLIAQIAQFTVQQEQLAEQRKQVERMETLFQQEEKKMEDESQYLQSLKSQLEQEQNELKTQLTQLEQQKEQLLKQELHHRESHITFQTQQEQWARQQALEREQLRIDWEALKSQQLQHQSREEQFHRQVIERLQAERDEFEEQRKMHEIWVTEQRSHWNVQNQALHDEQLQLEQGKHRLQHQVDLLQRENETCRVKFQRLATRMTTSSSHRADIARQLRTLADSLDLQMAEEVREGANTATPTSSSTAPNCLVFDS